MEDRVTMSQREIDRLTVIKNILGGKLTWPQAASQLRISVRQVGYLCARVKREGFKGIVHRLRGRPSNHRLLESTLEQAIQLVRRRYADFGPTFANEKLRTNHGIRISTSALRQRMIKEGLWKAERARIRHRAWRERRACLGELVQLDGSHHDWFEGRAPRCVLLVYIDDATSRILHAAFVESEDAQNLFMATQAYLSRWGRPVALYVDRDSIYTTSGDKAQPATQFARAMEELGIDLQLAYSPQAKGRVERGFKTHQDRLVKELRLRGIRSLEEANRFLKDYVADHNRRFAVEAKNPLNAHRPLDSSKNLAAILCVQEERTVFEDYTIRHRNRFLQLLSRSNRHLRPSDKVIVETRWDGSLRIRAKEGYVPYKPIEHRVHKALSHKPPSARPNPGTLGYARGVYVGPWTTKKNSGTFKGAKT